MILSKIMKEYTLNDIAQIKESTAQEIIDYLQSKGYAFTKSPDQPLTPSEIKLIDPILFFKLQHEPRTPRPQTQPAEEKKEIAVETPTAETELPKGMKLMKACRYFNQPSATIVEFLALSGMPVIDDPTSRLTDEQYDALKKQFGKTKPKKFHFDDILLDSDTFVEFIGIVHFYDDRKNHFGFLGTNDLCPQQTIRFTESVIKSQNYPSDSSLVSFRFNVKSKIIDAVKTLNRNTQINWKCALRYIGHYADIKGETRSGESRNVSDVLGRLIGLTNGYGLWDTLLELLDALKDAPERQKQFINEYLNHLSVFDVVAPEVEKAYDGAHIESFFLWQEAVARKFLEVNNIERFLRLRDLNPNIQIPEQHYDELRYILFARYGDVSAIENIQEEAKDEKIAEVVKALPVSEQEARLRMLPNDDFERIVINHMQGCELHRRLIEERWNEEKACMPYVVFDLESDGTDIKEFAFNKEDNFRPYIGEAQLKILGRAIQRTPIVVGHNIRVWDLPILRAKGFETDAFIWDTLEMEILLNPCRYAYSLHTEHNALADTELTNKLFWNQLYRLSKDKELCEELKDFLPQETDAIIQALQKPEYAALFEEEAANDIQFFQELISPDASLIENLQRINAIPETEPTLLIAPKDLWPRIAQYISLAFPKHDNNIRWQGIDPQLVENNENLTTFQKCVLRRFMKCSQTPIIANIPQYVRIQKKEDDAEMINGMAQIDLSILAECTNEPQSHIDCF